MMKSRKLQVGIAFLIGLVCLYLFARGLDWAEVWQAIAKAHYGWVLASVLLGLLTMYIRALRWQSFLGHPREPVGRLFLIMNIGFMANGVLPARMGEFIRPLLAGKFTRHRFSSALATIVVERVFDLMGILLFLSIVLLAFPFPVPEAGTETAAAAGGDPLGWLQGLAKLGVAMFFAMFCAIGVFAYAPEWSHNTAAWFLKPLPEGLSSKILGMVRSFEQGASTFRRPASFLYCFFLTIVLWSVITLSELMILWAFEINHVSFLGAMFIMAALCFAVMFPQAPGYIGVYQFALKLVLVNTFFIDESLAVAVAMVMWLAQIPPVILAGFVSLVAMGVSFHEISHAEEIAEQPSERLETA